MRSGLSFIIRASVVGNAVLLVLLVVGSHYAGGLDLISPHKPVHLRADLSIRLDDPRVLGQIHDAQAAWDEAVEAGGPGVPDIINNQAGGGAGIFDAIVVDGDPGTTIPVTFWGHNGTQNTVNIITIPEGPFCPDPNDPQNCWLAEARPVPASQTGVGQGAIVVILNTSFFVAFLSPGDAWRTITHEFGHVLSLGDHQLNYDHMMDSFPDTFPGDYQIANFNFGLFPDLPLVELFPDEASCVRLTFAIPGKQLCD